MRLAALLATTLADENRRRDEDCDVHNHIDPSEPRVERYVKREKSANSHADRGDARADHNGRARATLAVPAALVAGGLGHCVAVLAARVLKVGWWRCPRVAIDKGAAQPVQYNRQGICWHSTPQGRPEHAPKAGNAANQLASGCKTLAQDKKGRAPVFK